MENSNNNPGSPRRLQLRPKESGSSPNEKPIEKPAVAVPAKVPSLRLSPRAQKEPVEQNSSLTQAAQTPNTTRAEQPVSPLIKKPPVATEPEPNTPDDDSTEATPRKTSPIYYVVLAIAVLGSGYVLLKDRLFLKDGDPLPTPSNPTTTIAPKGSEPRAEPVAAPIPENEATLPEQAFETTLKSPISSGLAAFESLKPIEVPSRSGILVNGILYATGDWISKNPPVQFVEVAETSDGRFATLASGDERIRIPLY